MISLLIWLLILCVVMAFAIWIVRQLALPAPFSNIALAFIGIIFLPIILGVLFGEVPLRPLVLR